MVDAAGDDRTGDLLDDGTAFFGAITASLSHELNNVIAIIDQTGGLLQDMLSATDRGTPMDAARVSKAAGTVRQQAERGLSIIRRLNRFAHGADDPHRAFDVAEVVDDLTGLCGRLAELKRVRLTFDRLSKRATLVGSPFLLQAAAFQAFRLALDAARRDDAITMSVASDHGDTTVRVQCPAPVDTAHRDMGTLQRLSWRMGARVEITDAGDGPRLDIILPST